MTITIYPHEIILLKERIDREDRERAVLAAATGDRMVLGWEDLIKLAEVLEG